ncbi:hypothetical protein ACLVWU_17225 [Bdellovibrio sp. HCB290]|uniref:hypothetical protein n=1 Tax=Bdellovibrio sp. HCB290 TaxID=3394356 RepID=UPI0039B5EDDB
MKKVFVTLLASLIAMTASSAMAAGGQIGSGNVGLSKKDLADAFIVARLAIEGPYYAAQFEVNSKADQVIFRDGNMDAVREDQDCVGNSIDLQKNILKVSVVCKSLGNSPLSFEIDVTGVTKADLEKGTKVQVRSDATGGEWFPFDIIKRKKSFF